MPNDAQAQADLPEVEQTVVDPLDATSKPNGDNEFAAYEAEREALLNAPMEEPQGEEPVEPEAEPEEADAASDEPPNEEVSAEEEEAPAEESKPESGRFRIRAKDDLEIEALSLRKRHPEWSLKECLAKAEQLLGVPEADDKPREQEEQGETVQSVTQAMADLKAKRKDAFAALEFETVAELDDQYESLRDKREELRVGEARAKAVAEQTQAEQFEAQYAKSERITATYYPDATDPESKLTKRMIELDTQMRELGDPLYHSPEKPFLLAKAAARELGVMMAKPDGKAIKPTTSKSPIQPASGNARTTAAPSNKIEAAISNASSLDEYERLVGRG